MVFVPHAEAETGSDDKFSCANDVLNVFYSHQIYSLICNEKETISEKRERSRSCCLLACYLLFRSLRCDNNRRFIIGQIEMVDGSTNGSRCVVNLWRRAERWETERPSRKRVTHRRPNRLFSTVLRLNLKTILTVLWHCTICQCSWFRGTFKTSWTVSRNGSKKIPFRFESIDFYHWLTTPVGFQEQARLMQRHCPSVFAY